ncbi:MAG: ELM1/GtrOC1 family putative glycosyltransferase [bacterium]
MPSSPLNIAVITEGKAGHLSQSMGIVDLIDRKKTVQTIKVNLESGAEESILRGLTGLHLLLGFPTLVNVWRRACGYISKDDLTWLNENKPDLIISAGTIPASFNILMKRIYKCKNIVAMRPSLMPMKAFDLMVLPKHDIKGNETSNVISTLTSSNSCRPELIKPDGVAFSEKYALQSGEKYWAVFLGGPSKVRKFPIDDVISKVKIIAENARDKNVKLIISTSRRTEKEFESRLKILAVDFKDQIAFLQIYSQMPISTTKGILATCEHIFITEDSVSMVSESLWAKRMTSVVELPAVSGSGKDKIDKFKMNLLDENLITVLNDNDFKNAIKPVNLSGFNDVNVIRSSVNSLIESIV